MNDCVGVEELRRELSAVRCQLAKVESNLQTACNQAGILLVHNDSMGYGIESPYFVVYKTGKLLNNENQ